MDFFDYGHSIVDLIDPKFVAKAWEDVDKDEISNILSQSVVAPWVGLTRPQTPNYTAFINEIDKVGNPSPNALYLSWADREQNVWRCWERYGKKHITPRKMEQQLYLFRPKWKNISPYTAPEYLWVLVPLTTLSPQQNITLMESSHRKLKNGPDKPYNPEVKPGQALMVHAGLRTEKPKEGGGVVFARVYDVTGL